MRAISSVGRAALLHSEGQGFESLIAHKKIKRVDLTSALFTCLLLLFVLVYEAEETYI